MSDPYAEWDAAYVLGALSPQDRALFERHLAECDDCSAGVRALAPMPGLLATVPDLAWASDVSEPPPSLLPQLLHDVRQARRRRRWYVSVAAAGVAACLVLATVLLVRQPSPSTPPAVAMQPVSTSPVRATAVVQDVAWGTKITVHCTYDKNTYVPTADYSLVALDRSGTAYSLGTWRLTTGVTTFTSGVALPRTDLRQMQIRGPSDQELLQLQL